MVSPISTAQILFCYKEKMAKRMCRVWSQFVLLASVGLLLIVGQLNRLSHYSCNNCSQNIVQLKTIENQQSLFDFPRPSYVTMMVNSTSTKVDPTQSPSLHRTNNSTVTETTPYMITPRFKPNNSSDLGLNEPEVQKYLKDYSARCNKLWAKNQKNFTKPLCDCVPNTLVGRFSNSFEVNSLEYLQRKYSDIERGGHWSPVNCTARERVAIILPYKNRETHLTVQLNVLHPFLQRQQLDYRIFVGEQVAPDIFNKATTMNAAFLEASKLYQADCVIFHDIDMLPEDDRNLYTCSDKSPRHLGAYIDKFKYSLSQRGITIGGVSAWKPSQFRFMNGFSNKFYGWGGEDDDAAKRKRNWQGGKGTFGFYKDGLNSVQYELLRIDFQPLYTLIQVSVPLPPKDSQFRSIRKIVD